jgi:hypothetical protein
MFGYAFIYTNSKLKKAFISCDRKAKKIKIKDGI